MAAIIGCASVAVTDGIGILLRPGYNPVSTSVSALALGPTGWVQDVGMYLAGIGIVACAVGLYRVISSAWEVRLGELLLLLVGVGLVFAAAFKTGVPGQKEAITGDIHAVSSITSALLFLPVCFLISPAVRHHKKFFAYTIVAGIVAIGLEVGRGRLPPNWVLFGLHERLIGANALLWISLLSWHKLVKHN